MADHSAAIFVADDKIIWGHTLALRSEIERYSLPSDSLILDRFPSSGDLTADLSKALNQIASSATRRSVTKLKNLAVALPGPVKVSGMRTLSLRRDSLRTLQGSFGNHIRRGEFAGVDVPLVVQEHIRRMSGNASVVFEDYDLYVHHDAAAFAYGDYCFRREEFIRGGGSATRFDKSEIQALVLLDEGVGGAIIAEGIVAQGPTHSEMGHIFVERHPDDFAFSAACHLHEREGCLESLIGLPALRRRWGGDVLVRSHDAYRSWERRDPRLCLVAHYAAELITTLTLVVAPTYVSLVGRVATENRNLLGMIRGCFKQNLRAKKNRHDLYPGYDHQSEDDFINLVPTPDVGIFGALMLAAGADRVARTIGYKRPYNEVQTVEK